MKKFALSINVQVMLNVKNSETKNMNARYIGYDIFLDLSLFSNFPGIRNCVESESRRKKIERRDGSQARCLFSATNISIPL